MMVLVLAVAFIPGISSAGVVDECQSGTIEDCQNAAVGEADAATALVVGTVWETRDRVQEQIDNIEPTIDGARATAVGLADWAGDTGVDTVETGVETADRTLDLVFEAVCSKISDDCGGLGPILP